MKGGTLSDPAFHLYVSFEFLDNAATDEKTQTGAFTRAFRTEKRFEYPFHILFGYTFASIAHG